MTIRKNQHAVNWKGDEILVHPNYDAKGNALILQGNRLLSVRRGDVPDIHDPRSSRPATPLLTLRAVPENESRNFMGFREIVVISVNCDGTGDARLECGGEYSQLGGQDLDQVLFGDPGDGERIYEESFPCPLPLLSFLLIPGRKNRTILGFNSIVIVDFNYDGRGTALVRFDGCLDALSGTDLDDLLFLPNDAYRLCDGSTKRSDGERAPFEAKNDGKVASTRRIALYVRTSSPCKTDEAHSSTNFQLRQLRDAVDREGALRGNEERLTIIADEYIDSDASAHTLDRPELTRLWEDVKSGKIDHVMVTRIDRLTRSTGEFCRIISDFEKHSVSFASLMERIDTTTTVGKAMLKAVQLFDEMESLNRSERIKKGKKARKAKAPSK